MLVNKQASIPSPAGTSGFILLLGSTQSPARAQGGTKGPGPDHVPPNKAGYLISWPWLASEHRKKCTSYHTTCFTNDHASFSKTWIQILNSVWLEGSLPVNFSSGPVVQASVLHRNKQNTEKPWTCFGLWGISKFLSRLNGHLKNCHTSPVVVDIPF